MNRLKRLYLIAALVAWPLATHLIERSFPEDMKVAAILALASLLFYASCAIRLHSRVIAGALLGGVAYLMTALNGGLPDYTLYHQIGFYMFVGIAAGWLWEMASGGRDAGNDAALPSA